MAAALTPWLLDRVKGGNAILFLGAGAIVGASGPNGEQPLSGNQLRDRLCDRFLGKKLKDRPLARVAELAKSEASLPDLQAFVNQLFASLQPAPFHRLIPTFRWRAIATTNFDFVVERAYQEAPDPVQKLGPLIRDGDRFQQTLIDFEKVPYLKLHGCLSAVNDPTLPLILASEEYAKYRSGRERLFKNFAEWATEYPVIFCGYDIADPNLQQILFDLSDMGVNRPEYAVINPSLEDFDVRYWQTKRFLPLKTTFEDFLVGLDGQISSLDRRLVSVKATQSNSLQPIIKRGTPTERLITYLDTELEHVYKTMPYVGVLPMDFYRGGANSWGAVAQHLDAPRRITDDLLIESVLDQPSEAPHRLFILKGHAGSGKSVTLRRFAWNAANDLDAVVFWLKEGGVLRPDLFREIFNLTGERMLLVIDDVAPHVDELTKLSKMANAEQLPLTCVFGARTNEWNVVGAGLDPQITKDYEVRDLSLAEIDGLLEKLSANKCLGALQELSDAQRRDFFELSSERQLLVALHEATSGKTFEEIVLDEYRNLVPQEAKTLYLDVCTLHMFRVGVRAGLISRVSGVTFEHFERRLLKPLEHVVRVYMDAKSRDYAYRTRHSVIAEIVFQRVLSEQEERAGQLIRIIAAMNTDYDSDRVAFEELIRGRDLARLFGDRSLVDRIFEAARASGASDAHVEHQRAVFEINHPAGNVRRALKAIETAAADAQQSRVAIEHTRAMVLRRMANEATTQLEREKYRQDAKDILARQLRKAPTAHPYHTFGQLLMDELNDRLGRLTEKIDPLEERLCGEAIAAIEQVLNESGQRFPGDTYLLALESDYATQLNDAPRAMRALQQAQRSNPGNAAVAVRLSRNLEQSGDADRAEAVLRECLNANPNARAVRAQLAKLLTQIDVERHAEEIRRQLKSSFTEGDSNYESQFLYARHEFLFGNREESKRVFARLSAARVGPDTRNRSRGEVRTKDGTLRLFRGRVSVLHDAYCFVDVPEFPGGLFTHYNAFSDGKWASVTVGSRVSLGLAFTFRGPQGINAELDDR